jgi:hypothetical protein
MAGVSWLVVLVAVFAQGTNSSQTAAASLDFQFYLTQVEPIFLKPREGFGPGGSCFVCHTHVTSRFRLQPVSPGKLSWNQEQSRRNFEMVKRLVTPGDPLKSRLLLHPLAAEAGGDAVHPGGKPWQSQNDPEWRILAAWVNKVSAAGTRASSTPEPVPDFEAFKARVQPIFLNKRAGLARCYVCHSQGTNFRLQRLPSGRTMWNEEESRLNYEAVQRVVVGGEPAASRLLMLPLATEAGGEAFHPGGKRWASRDDPEWKMLASWVSGRQ